VQPFRRSIALVASVMLLSSAAGTAVPYTFARTIDGVQAGWPFQKVFWLGVGLTFLALIVRSLCEGWHAIVRIRELESVMLWRFKKLAAETICAFSVGQAQSEHSGFRQSVLSRGTNAAEQIVFLTLHDLWPMVTTALVVSVGLFATCPLWLAAATFALGGVQVAYRLWVNASYTLTLRAFAREETGLEKRVGELLRNLGVAMFNGQALRMLEAQDASRREFLGRENEFWVRHVWRITWSDLAAISARCVLFAAAAWLAATGGITVGVFLVCVTWSGQLLGVLDRFGQVFRSYARAAPHVARLAEMLAIPPAVREPAEPYFPKGDLRGEIEFQNVSFAYPSVTFENAEDGEKPQASRRALSGVSFKVNHGERVALVGKSGAGKSTVAQLLGRAFDPDAGVILIDGVDLRSYGLERLRSRIGYVEQDVTLFDGSVAGNIALGVGGDIGDVQDLESVLRQSRVRDFMDRLGDSGLDTQIGERGVKLSGGQRARIGIARALAKKPRIVIFDEATASLDAQNERFVYEAVFGEGFSGITAIIIAHNLRTIRRADRIVFFEGGTVIATGTHDELMASCAAYRELVEQQDYRD
jgi:ABC-type multidrug transport system fused ATPase/permease subunit